VALGPTLGSNFRFMANRIGFDAAVFFTPLPFRQLDLRAAFVVGWSIFEFHVGWQLKVVDATSDGSLARLFERSPAVNGPMVGVALSF
jgi:hypothetical protein